jgi:hypothetical protein
VKGSYIDKPTYTVISSPAELAQRIHTILDVGELYFAVEWDLDEQNNIDVLSLEESFTCWYGVKVIECFDAACLLVGQVGGENWLAFNITSPMHGDLLIQICKKIFTELEIEAVCVTNKIF